MPNLITEVTIPINFKPNSSMQTGDMLYYSHATAQIGGFSYHAATYLLGEVTDIISKTTHSVSVTGIQHAYGAAMDGKYFFFEVEAMNGLLGQVYNDATVYNISHHRGGTLIYEGPVKLWKYPDDANSGPASPSGGTTKGHGRYDPFATAGPGDWQVGDTITIDSYIGFNYTSVLIPTATIEAVKLSAGPIFLTFRKNCTVNGNSLKGYFALAKFINDDYSHANEMFSVSSGISVSSK